MLRSLVLLSLFFPILSFAQSASLALNVVAEDGAPLSGATLRLMPGNHTQLTDSIGNAVFLQLAGGTYKLDITHAGLENKRIPVQLTSGQKLQLPTVTLQQGLNQLSEVTVIAGRSGKYVETAPSVGLRLNVPLIEVPQNIAVTTKQTMLAWGILSTSELARTVSGVVKNFGDFNDFSFTIRGTDAYNNIFRNGVGGYWWNQQEDAAMIERIEFVKGPAGFMIGNSEPGGLVNIITKQPTRQRVREVEIGAGSYNLWRGSVDLGGAFSEKSKFSYRLAAGVHTQNGMVDFSKARRYFVSPSLRYNFSDKTYLQAEFNRMSGHSQNGSSPTLPSVNDQFHALLNNFSIVDPTTKGLKTWDNYSRLSLVHSFKNGWRLNAQTAYINGMYGGDAMFISGLNAAQDSIYRGYVDNRWWNNLKAAQAFVDGTIRQGKNIEHKVMGGIDYGRSAVETDFGYLVDSTFTRLGLSLANPQYGLPADSLKGMEYSDPSNWGNEWLSLYVQDHLKLYNKLVITLAGRLNYSTAWASYDDNTVRDVVVTPRFGLTWLFNQNVSAFAVYDECYLPQTGRKEDNTAARPLTGSNKELGVKALLMRNKLSLSASAYNTLKRNILVSNPATGLYVERGAIKIKGFDVDAVGTVNSNLSINANYTYTNARIADDANKDIIGQRVYGTPEHSGNLLLRYAFFKGGLKGFAAGAGASYMGNKSGIWPEWNDPKDRGKVVPHYTLLDANLSYTHKRFSLQCNVYNLLNTRYVSSGYYASATGASPGFWGYTPGLPLNFRTSLHVKL